MIENILNNWIINKDLENLYEVNKFFLNETLKTKTEHKDFYIKNIDNIKEIVKIFSYSPWTTQKEISKKLNIEKDDLIKINSFISDSKMLQNLILKKGLASKYWNTILPFASITNKVLNNEYSFPKRIALFPGVSCMFYCGFCGRNQTAKYPLEILDNSLKMYKKIFDDSDGQTSFSISGGLEPLTNSKIGEMISYARSKDIRIPIITNGYSLTQSYLQNNPGLWKSDSIRISLYGIDENSYEFITRVKKGYNQVSKNLINLLKERNLNNKNLKVGLNFIIIPENIEQFLKVPEFVHYINSEVPNGKGIDFITLRDDYQSVTSHSENRDEERKYRLKKPMDFTQRKELVDHINIFEQKRNKLCPDLFVDYGYSLDSLFKGQIDNGLIKINGDKMRKYGYSQISVAIDLYGDVFLFREAGFLNRQGNDKMIIGRISKNHSLEDIIKNFLKKNKPINMKNDDNRFMDSFDHVITSLVNQAEADQKFGIPFNYGPIKSRQDSIKMRLGNNWYSDTI
jgi:dTDP-4-amino-4,6-dideoxy-D-glucose ammonia-lyase